MSSNESATKFPNNPELEREARAWMTDPWGHFGMSTTRVHSVDREHAEAVQLTAMNIRLAERRQQIPVLAKLADGQSIDSLGSINDMAPLLFEHTVYKSYPVSLLAKQRYEQLNKWLDRLTQYDITDVDVSNCDSIDGWLDKLTDETPLDPAASSGTSGTMSFFPKSKKDYRLSAQGFRVQVVQEFGKAPTESDLKDKLHFLVPLYRNGHLSIGGFTKYNGESFAFGDESYLHTAFSGAISTDLMWLAGRLRAAQAKGDMSKVDAPASLLARLDELKSMQMNMPEQQAAFVKRMASELKGQRVIAMGTTPMFYEVAQRGLEEGLKNVFASDSIVIGGGGAKGVELPDNVNDIILEFTGASRLGSSYGMTEITSFNMLCQHGHYHFVPWLSVILLDRETGQPLPRSGVQTGRASFFDMTNDGTWGGLVTGDRVTVDWDTPCKCGRTTPYVQGKIQRYSEVEGGDDKITCAATPQAQSDALDYLTSLEI